MIFYWMPGNSVVEWGNSQKEYWLPNFSIETIYDIYVGF